MNGGRTEYNNGELDSGDNMDNGSNTTLNVYLSLDAIAEFKVLTSNYCAQYGRKHSGTVEVETKSGTRNLRSGLFSDCPTDPNPHAAFPGNIVPGFEFRAEALNVFNHIEYAWLGGDTGSAAHNSPLGSSNSTLTCYGGANNSAGDPGCTGANAYLRPAAAHNGRILQLGAKFIF